MPTRPLLRASLALLLAAGPLPACAPQQATQPPTPVTAAQYATFQHALGNPRARAAFAARCQEQARSLPADAQNAMSAVLDVDVTDVPQVFCERYAASLARGDISYEDFTAMQAHTKDMQVIRRVMRALRQPADEQQIRGPLTSTAARARRRRPPRPRSRRAPRPRPGSPRRAAAR